MNTAPSGTGLRFTLPKLDKLEALEDRILCLFCFTERRPLAGMAGLVDWRLMGRLSRMIIDGFFTAAPDDILMIPPEGRLPQSHIIVLGLGSRDGFNRGAFDGALDRMFDAVSRLDPGPVAIALPGRTEDVCESADAMEWFLEWLGRNPRESTTTLLETAGAQQVMMPILERWRLKHSIVPPAPAISP